MILLGSKDGKIAAALSVMHAVYFYFISTQTNLVSYALIGKTDVLLNIYFLFSTSASLLVLTAQSNYIKVSKNAVEKSLHLKNVQLMDASTRLQLSTSAGKIGLWDWDMVADMLTWDNTMCSLYGVTESFKVNFGTYLNIIHPEDRGNIQSQLELTTKGEKLNELEFSIIWPDKKW